MKATNKKKSEGYSSPYDFEGRIPLSQAIPLGLQHVMAMFIGNLTPLIIVMGVCGLTADAGFGELRTALLQNAMIIARSCYTGSDVFHRSGRRKSADRYGNVIRISRSSEQYRGSMRRRYFLLMVRLWEPVLSAVFSRVFSEHF